MSILWLVFGTGALSVYLSHVYKMAELRASTNVVLEEQRGANSDVRAELIELREQVRQLREEVQLLRGASTESDLSPDADQSHIE